MEYLFTFCDNDDKVMRVKIAAESAEEAAQTLCAVFGPRPYLIHE